MTLGRNPASGRPRTSTEIVDSFRKFFTEHSKNLNSEGLPAAAGAQEYITTPSAPKSAFVRVSILLVFTYRSSNRYCNTVHEYLHRIADFLCAREVASYIA